MAENEPSTLHLVTVSAADLAESGITLLPATEAPAIPEDQVLADARAEYPTDAIKELILARVVDSHQQPVFDRTCWVLSIDQTGGRSSGPVGSDDLPARSALHFIDAQTGRFGFGLEAFGERL